MKKLSIIILGLIPFVCLSQQYWLTKQAQLDNLIYVTSAPSVDRTIVITTDPNQDSATMITDLSVFLQIDTIFGNLIIQNTAITDFSGLETVVIADNYQLSIYNNDEVIDLTSLRGPKKVENIKIFNNPKLNKCTRFSSSISLAGIEVSGNAQLEKIEFDFDSITPFWHNNLNVYIHNNSTMDSINISDGKGLMSLITIKNNPMLESLHVSKTSDSSYTMYLDSLSSLTKISGFKTVKTYSHIGIRACTSLTNLCFVQEALINGNVGTMWLVDNGTGANSEAEILATDCSSFNTGINELSYNELLIYPNPAHDEVYVEVPEKATTYIIYDVSGKVVKKGVVEGNGRIGLSSISKGMYVLLVGDKRSKLIVQ